MKTDVKAVTVTTSGTAYPARTRVRSVVVMPSGGAGTAVLSDGVNPVMTFNVPATNPLSVIIPEDGVLFSSSVEIALTNATAVVFYG